MSLLFSINQNRKTIITIFRKPHMIKIENEFAIIVVLVNKIKPGNKAD